MKTIYYFLIWAFVCGVGSCAQDDTVNAFKELNEVTLKGLQEKYSVMLYGTLHIPLTLETSLGDESHLSYLWYMSTDTTRYAADTLSREKDLNVVIDPSHATPGENYRLTLKVTDETTGVYYRKEMQLEVTTQFTKGTVLLCEEGGEAEVHFLTPAPERTLIENIYTRANGGKRVGRNPVRIYSINPYAMAPDLKFEAIMCRDENGGMLANPVSFEALKPLRSAFASPFDETVLNPQLYFMGGMIDYILINGLVCRRSANMHLPDWEAPQVSIHGPAKYEVAPFVMDPKGTPIFYDRLNKRLLQHHAFNWGSLRQLDSEEADYSKFDCNHIGGNMEMLCCGNQSESGNFWMLMKDTQTEKYFVYKFRFLNKTFTSTLCQEVTGQVAPHLADALAFAANDDFPDVLLYATEQEVYSLSLNLLTAGTSDLLEALQVDLKPENMEITGLKFVSVSIDDDSPAGERVSMQLRLCVRDHNRTELPGGVVFYEINSSGGIHADYLYGKTGFCDTVVDIDEKYS